MTNKLSEILRPTAGCKPIGELVSLLESRGDESLKRSCEEHISTCANCSAELALFRGFDSPEMNADERKAVQAIVSRLRRRSPAVPARWWHNLPQGRMLMPASIGLAAVLAAITITLQTRPAFGPPSAPVEDVVRGRQLVTIAPMGDLVERPSELQWKPSVAASRYHVRLLEIDRTELWSTTVPSLSAALPDKVRAKITPLKKVLWEVSALDDTGKTIATSGLQSFRLLDKK